MQCSIIYVSHVLLLDTEKLLLRSNSLRSNKGKLFSPSILERLNHNSLMAGCSGISNQRETSQSETVRDLTTKKLRITTELNFFSALPPMPLTSFLFLSLHCEAFFHPLNQTRDHGTLTLKL